MRKTLCLSIRFICLCFLLIGMMIPASASEIVAPPVPDDVEQLMPDERAGLGEGLRYLVVEAMRQIQPAFHSALRVCLAVLGSVLIFSLLRTFTGRSRMVADLSATLVISCLLIGSTSAMIDLGSNTVWKISQYGKLLLPVMTAALAAEGGSVSATALYSATAVMDSLLCSVISSVLIPMVYVYIVFAIVGAAVGDDLLNRIRDLTKKTMTLLFKVLLYAFTAYISLTGIISGTADQTAVKAMKLTISGMIPVVGGILADASETILISAGVMKNAVGIYGLFAIIAVTIGPFLSIGAQYLLLKITASVCATFSGKTLASLLDDFSSAMGLLLAMTGSVCFVQIISVVCFLRGVT